MMGYVRERKPHPEKKNYDYVPFWEEWGEPIVVKYLGFKLRQRKDLAKFEVHRLFGLRLDPPNLTMLRLHHRTISNGSELPLCL